MDNLPVEEEHNDILMSIESAIVAIYRSHPELADYQVDSALEALIKTYHGEATGKKPASPSSPLSAAIYVSVYSTCNFRLGREALYRDEQPIVLDIEPVSVDVILLCLKRIRKSVRLWTKEGGRQGYLNYVSQFIG